MDKIYCDICITKIGKKEQIFYLFLIKSKNWMYARDCMYSKLYWWGDLILQEKEI